MTSPIYVAIDTPDMDWARAIATAVKRHAGGLKLGLYLSPADLNAIERGVYGRTEAKARVIPTPVAGWSPKSTWHMNGTWDEYNTYFLNQLFELLTEYGPISEVWFDGANPKPGTDQRYDGSGQGRSLRSHNPPAGASARAAHHNQRIIVATAADCIASYVWWPQHHNPRTRTRMAMAPTTAMVTHTHRLPLKNWAIRSMALPHLEVDRAGGTVAVPGVTLTTSTAVLLRRATWAAMDWRLTPSLWRSVSTMAPIMATSRIRPAPSK